MKFFVLCVFNFLSVSIFFLLFCKNCLCGIKLHLLIPSLIYSVVEMNYGKFTRSNYNSHKSSNLLGTNLFYLLEQLILTNELELCFIFYY